MTGERHNTNRARVVLGIFSYLVASLVVGALIAPWAFNALVWWGRRVTGLEGLRDIEFEKVSSRCVLVALLLGLIPALKGAGIRTLSQLGLARDPKGWRRLVTGWLLGSGSMALLLLLGLTSGAYRWADPAGPGLWGRAVGFVAAALVVGWVEEVIFRGALFGVIRRGFGLTCAAMLASLIFAAVHFAAPDPPVGVVHGRWNSGLYLLGYMFTAVDLRWGFGLMFLTLFTIGMILCLLYEREGTLYLVIGLHAGWVWVMRLAEEGLIRDRTQWTILFGPSMAVAKSGAALFLALAFLSGVALVYRACGARPPGRGGEYP